MLRTIPGLTMMSGLVSLAILLGSPAGAQVTQEPTGGQPAPGSLRSNVDFDYQIKYQRAFEAVLWSLPAVQLSSARAATFDVLGASA